MTLTPQQRASLKTDIIANAQPGQPLALLYAANDFDGIADWYSSLASPPFIVWRTSVSQDEIMQNGFDWTRVDNLSVGKARVWEWMFDNEAHAFNPSRGNVRAGIDAVWVGTQADLAVRAAIYVHCKRPATRAEKLFATGTGSDISPAVLSYEETVDGAFTGADLYALLQE